MNDLSWLLYLTGISHSIRSIAVAGMICSLLSLVFIVPIFLEKLEERYVGVFRLRKVLLTILSVSVLLFAFIPDRNIMYSIAASEISNKILEDPSVKPILEKSLLVIDSKLDDILENENNDKQTEK